uniref:Retrovirus-related Pol polyprotein from transposon TNT 1-94 n=1 Tax=Cajanus cajan TaxID=3821 RepID=A0A151RM24_CAJCA|nr:Retrovirus-related Pol polyprotein from transposon TNT 1-94 [Cajanus cajan]
MGHPPFKCWRRPDAKCIRCNQMSHEAVICKSKNQQQEEKTKVADQKEEMDQLFVATCFASSVDNESWLIDSGCTNYMTNDREIFKELNPTNITKVRIGNGDNILVKGKGTVAITSCSGTTFIPDVLLVPEIQQNLLSVLNFFLKIQIRSGWSFLEVKKSVENQSDKQIQILRSNGKEYTSENFNQFCEEIGIEHQLTTPYTPQQNGVSERRNKYILEMTRCMLHEKNLPKKFWSEAAHTVVFLQNRLLTTAVKDQTPYEAWYGHKPSLIFSKIFGCLCFTHIPIFIGYSTVSKAYKIFQPQIGSIVVSRDVHFVEDEEWKWDEAKKKIQSVTDLQFKFPASRTEEEDWQNELVDDTPTRGTRLLSYL